MKDPAISKKCLDNQSLILEPWYAVHVSTKNILYTFISVYHIKILKSKPNYIYQQDFFTTVLQGASL